MKDKERMLQLSIINWVLQLGIRFLEYLEETYLYLFEMW